ncbi:MAG: hypothetical protein N3B21_03485 [Clostridia bacterium]|nr:hypothetical protein [Clostridia bacterium]
MKINRDNLIKLMNYYCAGNCTRFARELGVDTSHLHRYLNTGIGGGTKIVGAVIKFCKINGLNFEEYVEL